ncbi:MAG: SagB/ThcOx family dehydrogenase [Planctomycetes bacterium]|nr:SagB/ThcOx family dehydrogenase [Planctomycetota bacterium]
MNNKNAVARYHNLTKYSQHSMGQGHEIDWQNPPQQCKTYAGADVFDMRPFLPSNDVRHFDPSDGLNDPTSPLGIPNIAKLLFATNGVTAVASGGQSGGFVEKHYFRAAPSAGALYPTDLYLLVRNHGDLDAGVYYFHAQKHSLVEVFPKGFGPDGDELFKRLQAACFNEPCIEQADMAIVATCVYWRSSWRYGERGYRRCLLDSGHVLGNLEIAGPRIGINTACIGGFNDAEVGKLIDVIPKREGILAVCPLFSEAADVATDCVNSAQASGLDSEPAQTDDAILDVHQSANIAEIDLSANAGELGRPQGKVFAKAGIELQPSDKDLSDTIELAILRRRSARVLTGESISFEELSDLLIWSYRVDLSLPERDRPSFFDAEMLDTYLVVQNVEGLEPGIYQLNHQKLQLHLIRKGQFKEQTFQICLSQDLAISASVVLIHTANLDTSTEIYGNRAYRYQHLDAGHLGQRLNVAAGKLGLGASGIGGFFDDEVNALLERPDSDFCVYITVIGKPA